jgi:hypothetical protein
MFLQATVAEAYLNLDTDTALQWYRKALMLSSVHGNVVSDVLPNLRLLDSWNRSVCKRFVVNTVEFTAICGTSPVTFCSFSYRASVLFAHDRGPVELLPPLM